VVRRTDEDKLLCVEGPELQVWMADGSAQPELNLVPDDELDDVFGVAGPD